MIIMGYSGKNTVELWVIGFSYDEISGNKTSQTIWYCILWLRYYFYCKSTTALQIGFPMPLLTLVA